MELKKIWERNEAFYDLLAVETKNIFVYKATQIRDLEKVNSSR